MSDFTAIQEYVVENISRPVKYIIYKLKEMIRVTAKFMSRSVPTNAASGYANIEKVEGNTVKFNQLVQNGDFSQAALLNNSAFNVMNGSVTYGDELTFTCGTSSTSVKGYYAPVSSLIIGHRYLVCATLSKHTGDNSNSALVGFVNDSAAVHSIDSNITFDDDVKFFAYNITELPAQCDKVGVRLRNFSPAGSTLTAKNLNIIDLTAIFTSGNEPDTMDEFVSWCTQNGIDIEKALGYSAGELLSCKMSGMQTGRLPQGYQELEYLESTGTQYIDTGIEGRDVLNINGASLFLKVAFMYANIQYQINGLGNNPQIGIVLSNGNIYWQNYNVGSEVVSYDTVYEVTLNYKTGVLSCTGFTDVIAQAITLTSNHVLLFAMSSGSSGNPANFSRQKLYNAVIRGASGTLLRNFIPAKRLSDNVLGMYDTVSNTFFTNAGTGDFTGGPEVHLDTLPFDVTMLTGINISTNTREVIFSDGMKWSNNVNDILDLANDTVTVKVGTRVFDGTENWVRVSANLAWFSLAKTTFNNLATTSTSGTYPCSHYIKAAAGGSPSLGACGFGGSYFNVNYDNTTTTPVSTFTNYLSTQYVNGTPVTIVYPLAAPITYTDIRDRYGNKINGRYKVESGGTEIILPQNTSTPISVAPILTTTYNKES